MLVMFDMVLKYFLHLAFLITPPAGSHPSSSPMPLSTLSQFPLRASSHLLSSMPWIKQGSRPGYLLFHIHINFLPDLQILGRNWLFNISTQTFDTCLELNISQTKLQTSSYKVNRSWGCNIQHGDCNNTVLYISKLLREQILNGLIIRKKFITIFIFSNFFYHFY